MCITAETGTKYLCESFFSKIKFVKSKNQDKLTDENLTNKLCCATSKLNLDFKKLADIIQK